jgi:hypothetical protein
LPDKYLAIELIVYLRALKFIDNFQTYNMRSGCGETSKIRLPCGNKTKNSFANALIYSST